MPIHGSLSGMGSHQPNEQKPFYPANIDTLYDYSVFLTQVEQNTLGKLPDQSKRVAIVGAGMAGMVAAYELLRCGIVADIYEASDRLGGRAWSKASECDPKVLAEKGAMRFPHTAAFTHYVEKFGLKLVDDFPDPGKVYTQLYYQNTVYKWLAGEEPPGIFAKLKTDWQNFIDILGIDTITSLLKSGEYEQARILWQRLIYKYRNVSFYTAISEGIPSWGHDELQAFGALGIGSGGFGPIYQVCFLEMLRLLVNGLEDSQQLLLEGITAIPDKFYHQMVTLPDGTQTSLAKEQTISFNASVTKIAEAPNDQVSLKTANGQCQTYDAVIVATTTRAMEVAGLTLSGPLGEAQRDGVRKVHLMNSSKTFIFTDTKFWLQDKSLPQNIQTDEFIRGLYCLDYGEDTQQGVVLLSYTWGDDSSKLLALTPEQKYQLFYENIATICPEFAAHLPEQASELVDINWQTEPFYFGAFKVDYPGQEQYVHDLYYQFQDCLILGKPAVYIAGCSISWTGGWVEGALETGLNAACAVIHKLGGEVIADSPLTQDASAYRY